LLAPHSLSLKSVKIDDRKKKKKEEEEGERIRRDRREKERIDCDLTAFTPR